MKFTTATVLSALTSLAVAGEIMPDTLSTFATWTGATTYNVQQGTISKPNGRSTDITTLFTFSFPADTQSKTCQLAFRLDDRATLGGTAQIDVFTSLRPATESIPGWPSGNLRDNAVGRLQAAKPGDAAVVSNIANRFTFPCPYGQKLGGELVGVGDYDYIVWDKAAAGVYIKY